jgi:hypothetical protein
MAPELLIGETHKIDRRSDIWSLGMILYHLLTGWVLATENTREEAFVAAIVGGERELEFPDTVPEKLKRICEHCLERDPNKRFDSAEALALALKDATAEVASPKDATSPNQAKAAPESSLHAWRLGLKLGSCRKELKQYAALVDSVLPHLLEGEGKLPPQAAATIQLALARELQAGNLYRECPGLASYFAFEFPALPDQFGRLFFKARKMTSQTVRELPSQASEFKRILDGAESASRKAIGAFGERALSTFALAHISGSSLPGESTEGYLDAGKASMLPEALWTPLLEAIKGKAEEGMILDLLNKMDKTVDRHISDEAKAPG